VRHISSANLAAGVVLTSDDVVRELAAVNDQIEAGIEKLTDYSERLTAVQIDYELRFAQTLLRSSAKSEALRRADALLTCQDLYREKATLEGQVRLIRDTQHDLRAMLSAVQSIGAGVRSTQWNDGQGTGGGGDRRG